MERSDYLVLVNKTNKVPNDWYEKVEMVEIKNGFGKIVKIEKETLEQFTQLRNDLLGENVDIELDSVYRSEPIQKDLFEEYKEKYGEDYASQYVAFPGYSEHHTGLALDIFIKKENGEIISENHEMIVECGIFEKIHKKLGDYGFILRYLDGKEKITGYTYEPWHLRYIGDISIAKKIYENGLTLEEYLSQSNNN